MHAACLAIIQEACTAAGVLTVPLTSSELNTRFRQLQVSADAVGLVQLDGAVLSAADTTAAAQTLADKAGVISRVSTWTSSEQPGVNLQL